MSIGSGSDAPERMESPAGAPGVEAAMRVADRYAGNRARRHLTAKWLMVGLAAVIALIVIVGSLVSAQTP